MADLFQNPEFRNDTENSPMLIWLLHSTCPNKSSKIVSEYDQEIPQSQTADSLHSLLMTLFGVVRH